MINFYKKIPMVLVFDTETNGLPKNYKASMLDVDNWPRICQLAWKVYTHDGKIGRSRQCIIKPNNWVIPSDVSEIHGFSTEFADAYGLPMFEALKDFVTDFNDCSVLVAHNISFDYPVLGAEMIRHGVKTSPKNGPLSVEKICTMLSSVDLCKIENSRGNYKWPKLIELYKHLFNSKFDGAHDAMIDVEACARCYFEMKAQNIEFVKI